MKRLTPWIWLTFAVTALVYSLFTYDGWAVMLTLLFFICFFADLYYTRLHQKQQSEFWERRKETATETENKSLAESEASIRASLAAGKLRYLVEWWEEDDLWIDENAHLLFIFTDGSEQDFTLYEPIKKKLVSLLADCGITWEPGFNRNFDSAILYPPSLRGQQFYTPDGKVRNDFVR